MSRLENSAKNILGSFGNNFVASLLGLISRTVFIYTLGADYLGLSGLLSNVLGFLAIGELGIATAIGFSLYKPLAEKDYKSISTLMFNVITFNSRFGSPDIFSYDSDR